MAEMKRAKFFYCEKAKIQDYINSGDIDTFDVIYTTDTHENIVISKDLDEIPVHSRILRFMTVPDAEKYLNSTKESYDGQIVAILENNRYIAYIVNGGVNGRFYVSSLNGYEGVTNYNTLGDKPITNLYGSLDEKVIVDQLKTGNYCIQGQYKISDNDETTYVSTNANLFMVDQLDDGARIKKISTTEIVDYIVGKDKPIITSVVPTTEWLEAQGYITTGEIDKRLAAMHFVTMEQIQTYVQDIVMSTLDITLDSKIEKKINEIFVPVGEKEIKYMF